MKQQQPEILSFPWLQAARVSKFLIGILLIQAFVIISLTVLIIFLFPLKEKIPVFVTFTDGKTNFVKIKASGRQVRNETQLIRYFIRDYVMAREAVNKTTERDVTGLNGRYSKVWFMSGKNVKEAFRNLYLDKKTGFYFLPGFERNVKIINDNILGRGVHLVELSTIDTIYGKHKLHKNWTVTLTYKLLDQKISYENGLLNPLGLFITEYNIQEKEKNEVNNEKDIL